MNVKKRYLGLAILASTLLLLHSIADAVASSITFIHQDHLGSASLVTDSEGNNPEKRTYYPFGATEKEGVIGHEPNAYNDKDLDEKTKLYNFEARMYAAQRMHFTTPDTIVPAPTDPQSWNRYAYVRNNPLKYVDPTGNSEVCATNGCTSLDSFISNGDHISVVAPYPSFQEHRMFEWRPVHSADLHQYLRKPTIIYDGADIGIRYWMKKTIVPKIREAMEKGIIEGYELYNSQNMNEEQFTSVARQTLKSNNALLIYLHGFRGGNSGWLVFSSHTTISSARISSIGEGLGGMVCDLGCNGKSRLSAWQKVVGEKGIVGTESNNDTWLKPTGAHAAGHALTADSLLDKGAWHMTFKFVPGGREHFDREGILRAYSLAATEYKEWGAIDAAANLEIRNHPKYSNSD